MIRPYESFRSTTTNVTFYEAKHRTPEIKHYVEDRNANGVFGFSPGSRKRGLWLGSFVVEDGDNNPHEKR